MIVVTVARRPTSESNVASNVLLHGCGGYNVEATRVEGAPSVPGSDGAKEADSVAYMPGLNATAGRRAAAYIANPPSGRWPANLVLQHREGCQQVGIRQVKGDGRAGDKARSESGTGGIWAKSTGVPAAVVYGDETIPVYECQSGCPVAALDSQSGDLAPQGGQKKVDTGDKSFLGTGHGGAPDSTFYGDRGGASRFFKQVKNTGGRDG